MNNIELITPWVLGFSVCLQFLTAGLALWLIKVTGRMWAWSMIAAAVFLMSVRSLALSGLLLDNFDHKPDLIAESITLVISLMLLIGILGITPMFQALVRTSQKLQHPITGLPNRHFLIDRLEQACTWSKRHDIKDALILINLDQFEAINKSQSQTIVDQLLQQIATQFRHTLRDEDTLAHLEDDQFVILVKDINENKEQAITDVHKILNKLQVALIKALAVNKNDISVTLSFGIAFVPDDGTNGMALIEHINTAAKLAKQQDGNRFVFYNKELQTRSDNRRILEKDLRLAIDNNEYILHYQAQTDILNQITGVEALVYWQHPRKGLIGPAIFIPLAEENDTIIELGAWVLATACRQFKDFYESDTTGFLNYIAINVSEYQFRHQNFYQQVENAIIMNGLEPHQLTLEMAESVIVDNSDFTMNKMHQLKKLGVNFAIDDFGTGYSSLDYLKKLPLDQLKINKSLIDSIETDPSDRGVIETTISMAQHLNLDIIAVGVENIYQLRFLQKAGCHTIQGYLYSHPLAAKDFIALLSEQTLAHSQ